MPIEFLTQEQRSHYGQFSSEPSENQLDRYFHLDDTDLLLINNRRGDHNRLGFAIQLTTVRFLGTFLANPTHVPNNAVAFVAKQIGDININCLLKYMDRKPTRHEHSNEIQQKYGYYEFNTGLWRFRLEITLYTLLDK